MEKFLNKLAEDEKLRGEFLSQTTPEGAYKVAKPYIGDMKMEEFAQQMVGLAKLMTKAENGELDTDALDAVSGGKFSFTQFLGTASQLVEKFVPEGEAKETIQGGMGVAGSTWSGIKDTFGIGQQQD